MCEIKHILHNGFGKFQKISVYLHRFRPAFAQGCNQV